MEIYLVGKDKGKLIIVHGFLKIWENRAWRGFLRVENYQMDGF